MPVTLVVGKEVWERGLGLEGVPADVEEAVAGGDGTFRAGHVVAI